MSAPTDTTPPEDIRILAPDMILRGIDHDGDPAQVAVRDGQLVGDPHLVLGAIIATDSGKSLRLSPDHDWVEASFADPVATYLTLRDQLLIVEDEVLTEDLDRALRGG